jgi:hypothetical protein
MELKVNYIIKKIVNKFDILQLKSKAVRDNIYINNLPTNISDIKTTLLYFPDYQMMHLGDHIFFEPLLRELVKSGFNVEIQPVKLMEFYFLNLGYQIGDIKTKKYDLIISRIEFYPSLKNTNFPIIYVEIANYKIIQPLCFDIIEKILTILKIKANNIDDVPKLVHSVLPETLEDISNSKDKYILFNNYIDSGSFRITKKHYSLLSEYAQDLKDKTGYKIIHTGSIKDKQKDKKIYSFVDIDLRGYSNIEDLFNLVQLNNVIYNVSFDAFQMHLFFMANKKSYVLFRGRFTKRYTNLFVNCFNPPFRIENTDQLIEYIK